MSHLDLASAIDQYLHRVRSKHSTGMFAAYSQALELFQTRLAAGGVKTHLTASADLHNQWAETYLAYLQENRSIETEHLYSRAILDFYKFAEKHEWAHPDTVALANYLASTRRPKAHDIPPIPMALLDTIQTSVASWVVPSVSDDFSERDRLRLFRDKAFLLVLSDSGLKVSEMCDLRKSSWSLADQVLKPDLPSSPCYPLQASTAASVNKYLAERATLDQAQLDILPSDT
ncbi:MAG: hypothetical protein GYB68_02565, partial [Chloroflexi bacterium]|nr:hypothetical protein [Chloroflexota bacterium]